MYTNLMIYPIGKATVPLIRYSHLTKYNEIKGVAPNGAGIVGKDISILDKGTHIGEIITSDYEKTLNECEEILFSYEGESISNEKYFELIKQTLSLQKKIYITRELCKYLKINKDEYNDMIEQLDFENIDIEIASENIINHKAIVILVKSIGEYSNKFNLQVALREKFLKDGYKVSQIGTKEYSKLFGFKTLPQFLFEEGPLSQKVLKFNRYIYNLINEEKSDIVIIGVPGGQMPIVRGINQYFGEIPYIISNAVLADITIYSLYFNFYTEEMLHRLKNKLQNKFNEGLIYFDINNTKILINLDENKVVDYLNVGSEKILQQLGNYSNSNLHVFNTTNSKQLDMLYTKIIDDLTKEMYII